MNKPTPGPRWLRRVTTWQTSTRRQSWAAKVALFLRRPTKESK